MTEVRRAPELPATPLFAGVEAEDWPELLSQSIRLDLATEEPVFRQGEDANAFFVLISGRVSISAQAKPGQPAQSLAELGAGAVLGETSLFLGGQHSASVYALEPSTLLQFHKEGFMEMIRQRHRGAIQVLYNVGHSLAVRLRSADQLLTEMPTESGSTGVIELQNRQRKIF